MKVSPECFIQLCQRVKILHKEKRKVYYSRTGREFNYESKVKRTGKGILAKSRQEGQRKVYH